MAFDSLQVKAVEGLLRFSNAIGDQLTTENTLQSWGETTLSWGETTCFRNNRLPLFSFIRDFRKQNTSGNVPKLPSIIPVIDRSDRNPPITPAIMT